VNNDTAADQVVNAIKVGYRLFDCAQDYGNEKVSLSPFSVDFRNAGRESVEQSPKAS
jgi:hypothetical protein